jgi:hypothetical protein
VLKFFAGLPIYISKKLRKAVLKAFKPPEANASEAPAHSGLGVRWTLRQKKLSPLRRREALKAQFPKNTGRFSAPVTASKK